MRFPQRLIWIVIAAAGMAACDGDGTGPGGTASEVSIRVYVDNDGSASQTPGDVAMSGTAVTLTPNTGGDALQATTDGEGVARFEGVRPGSYTAALVDGPQTGSIFSGAPTLVIRTPFEGAEIEREFRLEYLPSTVAGVVYRDDDASGNRTDADTRAVGFTVNLYRGTTATGTPLSSVATDAEGRYEFRLLAPGAYLVEVVSPFESVTFPDGATHAVTVAANAAPMLDVEFAGALLISIADALEQPSGTRVVVEGVVTAAQGTFNARSFYLQDRTGGVLVFGVDAGAGLAIGDSLRVTAAIGAFGGQTQLVSPTVEELGTGTVPAPVVLTAAEVNGREREGQLARVEAVTVTAVSGTATSTAYNVTVRDAAGGSFTIRVSGSAIGIPQTFWTVGGVYDVTGLLGSFNGTAQLFPRGPADAAAAGAATPIQQAKTLASGTEVTVSGVVTAGTAQLFNAFYLQDATSGVMVFVGSNPATPVQPGDSVTVTGDVAVFNGEVQLSGGPTVTIHKQVAPPAPVVLTGAQVVARTEEGELARVNDVTVTAVSGSASSTAYNVTVTDPAGTSFTVRVSGSSVGVAQTSWVVGARYDVIGVLGSFNGTAQLKVRGSSDVTPS